MSVFIEYTRLATRCRAVFALAITATLFGLSGCASLPEVAPSVTNFAAPPDPFAPLPKMVSAVMGDDARSGFRLLPVAEPAYETRVQLIRNATHTLDLQYYLFQADDTGMYMMRELRKAAERGVRVRLLIDDLYTSGEDPFFAALSSFPNIEIRLFNPFANGRGALWSRFALAAGQLGRVNHRMHNKLFIADNVAAIAGGRNIADEYFMRSIHNNFVDIDLFAVGPVVQDLSAIFDYYWNSDYSYPFYSVVPPDSTPEALQRHFDELTIYAVAPPAEGIPPSLQSYTTLPEELRTGHLGAVIHADGVAIADPLDKAHGVSLKTISATVTERVEDLIGSAQQNVVILSPYFVPGKVGLKQLTTLAAKGVDVTVVTNSLASTDEPVVQIGYVRYRKPLLEAGVHIRELSPTLSAKRELLGDFGASLGALHAKLVVVDKQHVFMGSMNLDERSAFENTEMGVIIDSAELAAQIGARTDRQSSYALRLSPEDQIQWVADINGQEVVFDHEPEADFWTNLEVELLGPFVPESQL
jgi:phosphatidylserine/phosphatidylglycerophosphate/cardiolipin synthase-like enzyme